jgi:aspartokinase
VDKAEIGGIIYKRHLVKIGVLAPADQPGFGASILDALGQAEVNVQFIAHMVDDKGSVHIAICVDQAEQEASMELLGNAGKEVGAEAAAYEGEAAMISIFGPDFREKPGIAGAMLQSLISKEIEILAVSTSISTVTCVIDSAKIDDAVAAINEAFALPGQDD